jgi:hypothetical protein
MTTQSSSRLWFLGRLPAFRKCLLTGWKPIPPLWSRLSETRVNCVDRHDEVPAWVQRIVLGSDVRTAQQNSRLGETRPQEQSHFGSDADNRSGHGVPGDSDEPLLRKRGERCERNTGSVGVNLGETDLSEKMK